MITIVDYQMGNLRSVQKGIEKAGGEAVITSDSSEIANAEKLIDGQSIYSQEVRPQLRGKTRALVVVQRGPGRYHLTIPLER